MLPKGYTELADEAYALAQAYGIPVTAQEGDGIDAFRHAYAAAYYKQFLMENLPPVLPNGWTPSSLAYVFTYALGAGYEILSKDNQTSPERIPYYNQDLWNNMKGAGYDPSTGQTIGEYTKQLYDSGALITDVNNQQGRIADIITESVILRLTYLNEFFHTLFDPVSEAYAEILEDLIDFFDDYYGTPDNPTPLSDPMRGAGNQFETGMESPIALDLDGDGQIEYVARANSDVFFDIDNDHFAEHVEWLKGDDGFLVRDTNGNGQIDSVAEMFGGNGGTTAWAKLDALDTNAPAGNVLDAADAAWSTLRVWRDANENGRVDSGELKTLAELGITSIGTASNGATSLGGHAIAGASSFIMNGGVRTAADVLFDTDQMNSWYIGDGTAGSTEIDLDTLFLPLSRGYGTLPSLHYAMTQDAALKGLVEDFATLGLADMDELYERIDDIILQWADAENIATNSRGAYVNGAHLRVLERINDQTYVSAYGTGNNPADVGQGPLGKAYALFANEIMERLLVQGPLQGVFANAAYDFASDRLELNDTLANVLSRATASQPTAGTQAFTVFWTEIGRIVGHYHGDLGATRIAAKAAVDNAAGFYTLPATVVGTSANDVMGSHYDSDVFYGGAGNDNMSGGKGDDVYVFRSDSGNDVIVHNPYDDSAYDVLRFETVNSSQVVLSKSGDHLVVTASSIGATVTVTDHFRPGWESWRSISEIQFANGEIWNTQTINNVTNGALAPAPVTGSAGNDILLAASGTLNLIGGAGADRFVVTPGSSKFVTIADYRSAQGDIIDLTAFDGILTGYHQLTITDRVGHATVTIPAAGGSITLNLSHVSSGQLSAANFGFNSWNGGAGTTVYGGVTADAIFGTGGNDALYGNEGNDAVSGGAGNDTLWGWTGDDTINGGSGNDVIGGDQDNDLLYGGTGNDTIYGGTGADTMIGGPGDDSYYVDQAGDSVIEAAGEGYDIVYAEASYGLLAGRHIEVLATIDNTAATAINLTGNELANYVIGNAGANRLDGGSGGADQLWGREGDDSYFADSNDLVVEYAGHGYDIVYARSSFALAFGMAVEILATIDNNASTAINLIGNELANYVTGNAGANTLDGGGGSDQLWGREGDDSYFADMNDVVIEYAGQGSDILYAREDYILAAGLSIETLATADNTATIGIDLYGNEFDNYLSGNAGANTLDGGAGSDTLWGRGGDDSYFVESNDVVREDAGQGNDIVYARGSFVLGAGVSVEILATVDNNATTAINLTGNELANYVTGNAGANILNGGAGADQLFGRGGVDTFAFTTLLGGGNVDQILDFVAGTDKIAVDDAIFAGIGTPGSFNPNAFFAGTAAHDLDDRIIYNQATGQLFYDADGSGAGAAVLFAILSGRPGLTASDFAVV